MNKRKSKIFSIGLPMDASVSEFEDFLVEFGELLITGLWISKKIYQFRKGGI